MVGNMVDSTQQYSQSVPSDLWHSLPRRLRGVAATIRPPRDFQTARVVCRLPSSQYFLSLCAGGSCAVLSGLEMKMLSSSGCSRGPNLSLGTSHCSSRRDVSDSGLKRRFLPSATSLRSWPSVRSEYLV